MKARIPGNAGGQNMNQMLKQAQKMQADMAAFQEDFEQREFEGKASGDMVAVTINGKHEVLNVKIKPDVVDPDDIEMLEDMVALAFNNALSNANKVQEEEMGAITGGMNLPGLF